MLLEKAHDLERIVALMLGLHGQRFDPVRKEPRCVRIDLSEIMKKG